MSTCTSVLPATDSDSSQNHISLISQAITSSPRSPLIIEDLSLPNIVRISHAPKEVAAINTGLLTVTASLAQRVNLRLDFETKVKWRGQRLYKRLRASAVICSCPNVDQAELFIKAMQGFAASLSGKWLAPAPEVSEVTQNHTLDSSPGSAEAARVPHSGSKTGGRVGNRLTSLSLDRGTK